MCVCAQLLSHVQLYVIPWTATVQAPLSMKFPRQGYLSGLPFSTPGDLPDPGIELMSPALAGRFFTTEPPGKPPRHGWVSFILSIWAKVPWTMFILSFFLFFFFETSHESVIFQNKKLKKFPKDILLYTSLPKDLGQWCALSSRSLMKTGMGVGVVKCPWMNTEAVHVNGI